METLKKNWPLFVCTSIVITGQIGSAIYIRRQVASTQSDLAFGIHNTQLMVDKGFSSLDEKLAEMDKTLDYVHRDTVMLRVEQADIGRSR